MNYLHPMNLFRFFSRFKIGKSKQTRLRNEISKIQMHMHRPQPIALQQEIKRHYIITQKIMPALKGLAIDILSLLFTARVFPKNLRFSTIALVAQRSYGVIKYLFVNHKPNSIVSKSFNKADEQYTIFTKYAINALRKSFNKANEQATKRVHESLKSFWKSSNSSEFEKLFAEQDITQCKTATELQALKERIKIQSNRHAKIAEMHVDMDAEEYGYIPSLLITPMYMLKNLFISPAPEPQTEQPTLVGCLTQVPAPAKKAFESLSNIDKLILYARPPEKTVATKEQEEKALELNRAKFAYGMR